ncbi:MAG: Fic family protein [Gammaproteobacteria bacterium]|nr:Fic family protein [Gammaproteobacteria bacterium]
MAGFSYQLALSLKAFFGRVVDEGSTATLAFDGLSDLAEFDGDLVYLTQIKRTLTRKSQKSAVAEFLEIDRFLERDYPAFRARVCFRVICSRRAVGLDEAWDPARLGLADDEARRWERIRESQRFHGYQVEGDPRIELAIQLWKTVPRPYDFVNACIAKLQHLLGLNRGSDEIVDALLQELQHVQDLQHATVHGPIVGTLLGPRDFEPADTPSNRILIGQRPRLADLREGCFLERTDRVRPILEVIEQAIPLDSSRRDGGRKVPVVWISGGSGVGKSALLLQSLREVVCDLDLPVIYLEHFAEDLPRAIEQVGSGRALIVADDLYAPDERRPELWREINRQAHRAPNITLLACGPDESREAFVEMAHGHGVLSVQRVDVPLLTEAEQGEYFQWFCARTGGTDLRRPTQANFVVAAFTLDRARQGFASVEEFAARLKQRLQALGIYEIMLMTLAVNRMGIRPPVSFFGGVQDALRELKDAGLVWLNEDPAGRLSVSFHAAIGRTLYEIYRPERASAEARALDIAAYFRAVVGDQERARSLISLLGGDKKGGKRIPEQFAIDALEKIWEVLIEDKPPHLEIGLLLACKSAITKRRPEAVPKIVRPDRILGWMGSRDVNAEGWALLLETAWDVLPPDRKAGVCRQAVGWLEQHLDLAPWNYLWQILWKDKYERAKLVDLAQNWLQQHVQHATWNRVFQPLIDSGERAAWMLENARQALRHGPATGADVRVWDKVKRLDLTDYEAAKLLLVRLCKSRNPKIHFDGAKRLAKLRGIVDVAFLVSIFRESPEEPGSPFAFSNLCRFMVGPRDSIRRDLFPVALTWLQGREDRPEWSHVWRALLALSPDETLRAQGRVWLEGREDRPEWSHVWEALLALTPGDAALQAQGCAWLEGRADRPEWSHVWKALLALTPDETLQAQGRAWLEGREDRPEWAFVWQAVLALTPGDAALQAQGRAWLEGREDRPEWNYVWRTLLALTPGDAALQAQGRAWLEGREDRPKWNDVWRALLALTPGDAALQAQGCAWLEGREDRPEWSHVWEALLKSPPNDAKLRELLELGAAWCRDREDRIEYPYVEREIKRRAARYWRHLPQSERGTLLQELIVQWTHDSTAIEGNTLTLGETKAVIEHGLTIRGKPLKDHHEVIGHKRALELVYSWSERSALRFDDLFDLHRAVLMEAIFDIMQPIGAWKVEKNRVAGKTRDGRIVDIEFADPAQVSTLMEGWLHRLNHWLCDPPDDASAALDAFVELHVGFVRVHPFFDGNGRMARLLANLPLLMAGFPPLIVPEQKREEYKLLHREYDLAVGRVESPPQLSPEHELLREIRRFCRDAWQPTLDMVAARVFRYWMR